MSVVALAATGIVMLGGCGDTSDEARVAALEQKIHQAVNQERGWGNSLTVHRGLARVAEAHCYDMYLRKYFSHTTPDGISFSERIRAAGIDYQVVGENLFHLEVTGQAVSDDTIVDTTIQKWLNSPGHRKNMLDGRFAAEGIGVFLKTSGNTTSVFVAEELIRQ